MKVIPLFFVHVALPYDTAAACAWFVDFLGSRKSAPARPIRLTSRSRALVVAFIFGSLRGLRGR